MFYLVQIQRDNQRTYLNWGKEKVLANAMLYNSPSAARVALTAYVTKVIRYHNKIDFTAQIIPLKEVYDEYS